MNTPRALLVPRLLVAVFGGLLAGPGRLRWKQEWDAELIAWFRRHRGRPGATTTLLRRALLSPFDALAYRRRFQSSLPSGSNLPPSHHRKESIVESLLKDLKFAVRSCRKQPALTAVLLLTMTLGIGGTTAIFSLLHGIVLAPLPYPQEERIVQIWPARSRGLSKALLVRLGEEATSYGAVAGFSEGAFRMRVEDHSEMIYGPEVSAEFFRVLGARPVLGRSFQPGDDQGEARLAVLSWEHWQERYGGDPGIVGHRLNLDGEPVTVVGVMEAGLELPQLPFDLALNHRVEEGADDYEANYLDFVGRLGQGVSVAQADAEFRTLTNRWAVEEGVSQEWAETAAVVSLREHLVGDVRGTLLLLFGAVGFILLIVAANVANLLLARTLSREEELSVRTALGATRGRLTRQLLTETTALALVGGILGLGFAVGLLRALKTILPPETPRLESLSIAPQVLAFAFAVAALTGVAVGLVPAVNTLRIQRQAGLGGAGRQTARRSRHRLRSSLVVAEVTLAVVLLVGAGVMMKSFWRTLQVDPGFHPEGLVQFSVLPGDAQWESPQALEEYFVGLRERLRAVPGVTQVATVHAVPVLNGGWVMGTYPADDPPPEGELPPRARWRPVSPEYFQTAGIEVIAGAPFTDLHTAESEPVVILNERAARTFFGSPEEALGKDIYISFDRVPRQRVIGVVSDVRILGLREEAPLAAYRPFAQGSVALHGIGISFRSMMVRSELPAAALAAPLREAVVDHDPFANVLRMESMGETIAASVAQPRVVMLLLSAFAGVALLLGAIGIYGVMGYSVRERRREMGIRIALGAPSGSILKRVMAGGLGLTALGLLFGAGLALGVTRLLSSQLFQVHPADPLVLAAAAGVLLATALLAVYLPARRAGRVDPVEVLRAE